MRFLFEQHPDLELRLYTTTDFEFERHGDQDLSIHYIQPTDPSMITLRLGKLHFIP